MTLWHSSAHAHIKTHKAHTYLASACNEKGAISGEAKRIDPSIHGNLHNQGQPRLLLARTPQPDKPTPRPRGDKIAVRHGSNGADPILGAVSACHSEHGFFLVHVPQTQPPVTARSRYGGKEKYGCKKIASFHAHSQHNTTQHNTTQHNTTPVCAAHPFWLPETKWSSVSMAMQSTLMPGAVNTS